MSELISCLTVTQPGRIHLLERAVDCFRKQSYPAKELVIVHDGGESFTQLINDSFGPWKIPMRVQSGHGPLGALRNLSIALAAGSVWCQWDDDDIYHPDRLAAQYTALGGKVANVLKSQYYYFSETRDIMIYRRPEFIEGTIMLRRTELRYPELVRGEDGEFIKHFRAALTVLDRPELYCRTYHGKNAWPFAHHHDRLKTLAVPCSSLLQHRIEIGLHLASFGIEFAHVRDFHQVAFDCTP